MIDDCIGRVLRALLDNDLADDTFVIFTSDHGEFLGDHGLLRKGPPPYYQLLHVPLMLAGPGINPIMVEALTSHVDLKATILDLLGVAGDDGDGVSLGPTAAWGDRDRTRHGLGRIPPARLPGTV